MASENIMGLCLILFCLLLLAAFTYICKSCGGGRAARTSAVHYDEGGKTCTDEIDSMRAATILRWLNGFTLKLTEEHILSLSRTITAETVLTTLDCSNRDIEEGSNGELESSKAGSVVEHTHISIPLPGHDVRGEVCVEVKEEEQATSKMINNEATKQPIKETRVAPIFCAVCLAKYELSERVCWASNSECSHVFHEQCILQWLVSLGKRKTTGQQFDKNSSEEELMKYQPECPCCRQHFIDIKLMAVSGDERV